MEDSAESYQAKKANEVEGSQRPKGQVHERIKDGVEPHQPEKVDEVTMCQYLEDGYKTVDASPHERIGVDELANAAH